MTASLVYTLGAVCTSMCEDPTCPWEFNGATWPPLQVDAAVPAAQVHTDATGHRVQIDRVIRTQVVPLGRSHAGPSVPLDDLDTPAAS